MTDREFLIWLHARLVKKYGENPLNDYMHRLRRIIKELPKNQKSSAIEYYGEFIVEGEKENVLF